MCLCNYKYGFINIIYVLVDICQLLVYNGDIKY
nr:MAG TPA: hypothetical protein [Caudoviricetes sp.]